ncbi:putative quinone oxidoreductase, YhdH/YhfP family [Variovorax sp. HW608]|uniref:acrylyl-CoA reductase family protein n=1 Tax=Variovorax sp. HW608 TaxID=1034889 RepID=UPI00081FB820|nr:acryloyl-CoA reductase [Variovorax sp. HW608]SCK26101.1 putative quinone oxidoreductase, YhdH/YhfP family [Variovorax sp. HW608]
MRNIDCICILGPNRPGASLLRRPLSATTPGSIVVRVEYAGLNYKDALATMPDSKVLRHFPRIGGSDFSGVVVESLDPFFRPGDKVFSCANGLGVDRDGGFAEFVRIDGTHLRHLPAALSAFEICALGVAGITAALSLHLLEAQGLVCGAGPVLVTGATGGVGTMAIEMLARLGHEVIAHTAKPEMRQHLLDLGASDVISTTATERPGKPLERATWAAAIDTIGGDGLDLMIRRMMPRGCIASVGNAAGNTFASNLLPFILRGVRIIGVNLTEYAELMDTLMARLADELKPVRALGLTQIVDMEDVPHMLNAMLERRTTGRIVMHPFPTGRTASCGFQSRKGP